MKIEYELQFAPGHAGSGLEADERTHTRYMGGEGIRLRLAVQPTYRGHRAVLCDISVGGVGLLMERPLEAGTVIAVELRENLDEGVTRIARVAHSRPWETPADAPWLPKPHPLWTLIGRLVGSNPPQRETCWFVGCKFDSPLNEDELHRLLSCARHS